MSADYELPENIADAPEIHVPSAMKPQKKKPRGRPITSENAKQMAVNSRYELRPLSSIHAYAKNPRKNAAAVDKVANSIREFGFKVPVVIDSEGTIIAGHTRFQAAKKLKIKEVPCIVADDLNDEQAKAFRLADNKVGEFAEWDMDLLADELDGIDLDMSQFGFEPFEEHDEPEPPEPEPSLADHFTVIVECKDEFDQQQTFEKLQAEGFKCRLSTL